jgi:hypothetical protein
MTTKEKFEELKIRDMNAKSDVEREKLHIELEKLADQDPEGFEKSVIASAKKTLSDIKELKIKEQLAHISGMISMAYISENYFNKSKSWMSQRINELDVNGKPAKFTQDEIERLNFAIQDISAKLGTVRISC